MFLADFPRASGQSDALKEQNKALSEKYGIRGFPTVLLLKADGTVIEKTGYQRGGPEAYVKHIKSLIPATAAAPAALPVPELPAVVDQDNVDGTES